MPDRRLAVGLAAWAALWLCACGFQPLYGESTRGDTTLARLAAVEIAPPADRLEQLVYTHLVEQLPDGGASRYRLVLEVAERKEGLAIQLDDTVTRFNLTLTARFVLTEIGSGEILLDATARAISAYNVVISDYANLIAERDARARAAQEIADAVGRRVSVKLSPVT